MGLPHDFAFPDPADAPDELTRLATTSWNAIARLFLSQQQHRDAVAADLGLNMAELVSLFHLDPEGGISQRDLAEHWSCDPSWVTNRIDRLEDLDLAERRVSATDRRVKEVWLTAKGRTLRTRGMAGFGRPPEALAQLTPADLEALARILSKVEAAAPTP